MPANDKPGCLAGILKLLGLGGHRAQTGPADDGPLPYLVRDDFFSEAEASFYRLLSDVVGEDFIICPKVSLREIFFVSRPNQNLSFYNKIDRKHVDYLLCDARNLKPVLGIELDDKSHTRPDRVERDEFVKKVFACAGLRLARMPVRTAYSAQELRRLVYPDQPVEAKAVQANPISEQTATLCPKCGVEMVLRTATRGAHAGKNFYGCPNYPRCKEFKPAH